MTVPPGPPLGKAPAGLDPEQCEREAIHLPGATQPHGAVVAARTQNLRVTHCSANLADILGRPPAAVLGSDLSTIIGPAALETITAMVPTKLDYSHKGESTSTLYNSVRAVIAHNCARCASSPLLGFLQPSGF